MNKEQLMAIGLTEEQADKVVAGFGQMIPKSRLDEKIKEVKDLEKQIGDRDRQLEDLKKIDAEGLKEKIKELQKENETAKTEYETKLKDTQLTSALKLALNGKVHDTDLVAGLIDKTTIELGEDGNITKGLEEQIKTLQESKSFLFVQKDEGNSGGFRGFTPVGGTTQKNDDQQKANEDFGKNLANFATNNKDLDKARDSYFN